MGFFSDSRRGMTRDEYQKHLRGILHGSHFSKDDLHDVDMALQGYFSAEGGRNMMEADEAKEVVAWLRKNKSSHSLSDEQIGILEREMGKFL